VFGAETISLKSKFITVQAWNRCLPDTISFNSAVVDQAYSREQDRSCPSTMSALDCSDNELLTPSTTFSDADEVFLQYTWPWDPAIPGEEDIFTNNCIPSRTFGAKLISLTNASSSPTLDYSIQGGPL